MVIFIWAVVGAIVGAAIGSAKNRVTAGLIWGLLLGPIGWLIVAVSPAGGPKCSACKGVVAKDATKCCHCGTDIVWEAPQYAGPLISHRTWLCIAATALIAIAVLAFLATGCSDIMPPPERAVSGWLETNPGKQPWQAPAWKAMVAKAERQAQPYDEKPHWLRLLNSVRPMGKELLFMNTGTDSLVYPRWSTTDTAADRKRSEQAYYGSDK